MGTCVEGMHSYRGPSVTGCIFDDDETCPFMTVNMSTESRSVQGRLQVGALRLAGTACEAAARLLLRRVACATA